MYLLFAGEKYEPKGGAWDFVGAFSTSLEARAARPNCDWAHVAVVYYENGIPTDLVIVATWETTDYGGSGQWIARPVPTQ